MFNLELNDMLEHVHFINVMPSGKFKISIDLDLFNNITEEYFLEHDIFNPDCYKFKTFQEYKSYLCDVFEFKREYCYKHPEVDEIIDILDLMFGKTILHKFIISDSSFDKSVICIIEPSVINQNLNDLIYNY